MTSAVVLFGAAIAFCIIAVLVLPRGRNTNGSMHALAAHSLTQSPTINYSANPYRVGAYVYVMEDSTPSEHDWAGTYIGMSDGMAMVRDTETHVVAHVSKDQLYGAQH